MPAIAQDTCNFSINMPKSERALWGKASFQSDESIGHLLMRLALNALRTEQPEVADSIHKLRMERRAKRAGVICVSLLVMTLFVNTDTPRPVRSARPGRRWEMGVEA